MKVVWKLITCLQVLKTMKKEQTGRLSKQHALSGGASSIFGEDAKVHDSSVQSVGQKVFTALNLKYEKYKFRYRPAVSKKEINDKLNSIDNRLGITLQVQKSSIKPDGGIIEVQNKNQKWRVILVSEAKYQGKDVENIKAGLLVGKIRTKT